MILEGIKEKQLFTNPFPMRIAVNSEDNFLYPEHWHNASELVYVLEGDCYVRLGKNEYHLTKRDILHIPPGEIHSLHITKSKGFRYFIQFDFRKIDKMNFHNQFKPFSSQEKLLTALPQSPVHAELEIHLLKIIEVFHERKLGYELLLCARIFDIAAILFRAGANQNEPKNTLHKMNGLDKLEKAFQYIEENYNNIITLKDISKHTGFSEYHFSRIFKEATDMNFLHYLNEYRIKMAEQLLTEGLLSITQVAVSSGFNSLATFNRIFKQIKGCSPREFLKLHV